MNDNAKSWTLMTAAVVTVGLIIIAVILGSAYRSRNYQKQITVTGSSQQVITSDVVSWGGTFSRTVGADSLKQGNAELKTDSQTVLDFLKKQGITENELDMQPVSVSTNYNSEEDKNGNSVQVFTGYTLSQTFHVESHDLSKVAGAITASGSLLDQGLLFQSVAPQYFYSKLSDLKIQMINDATRDATNRAEAVAKNADTKVGSLKTASVGVIQITPENSSDLTDEGAYDTSSVKKQVTVVVHASFSIK